MQSGDSDPFELRLFLEEICCDLCRFVHVSRDGIAPEKIRIDRQVYLGETRSFADIRVQAPRIRPYVVEVKYGYDARRLTESISRKYGSGKAQAHEIGRVVLVVDVAGRSHWPEVERQVRESLARGVELDVWDEERLLAMVRDLFGVPLSSITANDLLDVREAIDHAKGRYAFGDDYAGGALESSLLWHFGFWRLRQLREAGRTAKRSMVPPGLYREAVVMMADLTGFSSYVRDTPDERVVRSCLTAFYSTARHQILNTGGFMYQFLGDAVIALWGIPDQPPDYLAGALECAAALADAGNSVSNEWQRQIDRVQQAGGVHIGMAMGDLQLMAVRPFSRINMGLVGDSINVAARLTASAGSGEVVVSNTLYRQLDPQTVGGFQEMPPIEAKNVGRIRAWRRHVGCPWPPP